MAIDMAKYGSLAGYSSTAQKEAGPFVKVFISGEQRDDQDIRKMHAIVNNKWDSKDISEKYLIHNASVVNFIIMFIKKVRVKRERLSKSYDEITYYSYDPDNDKNYPADAKCEFIFAGALLDANFKPVMDKEDPSRAALIYFQNSGMRVGPSVEYLGELSKKAGELKPLTPDPNFEKSVVTPRRFITQVKIGSRKSSHGNKDVFEYSAIKQLPDANVETIMDRCIKWLEPFDTQFNLSSTTNNGPTKTRSSYNPDNDNPSFDDDSVQSNNIEISSTDLDLGI